MERGRKIDEEKKRGETRGGKGVQCNSLPNDRRALLSERLEQAN